MKRRKKPKMSGVTLKDGPFGGIKKGETLVFAKPPKHKNCRCDPGVTVRLQEMEGVVLLKDHLAPIFFQIQQIDLHQPVGIDEPDEPGAAWAQYVPTGDREITVQGVVKQK